MGRSDEAYALLAADPGFLAEVQGHFGSDRPALFGYLGALRMKGWMTELARAWDEVPADELKDLLAAWSSRYLRNRRQGSVYGYGPLTVEVRAGSGVTVVTASVRSVGPEAPLGGILRIRTLAPAAPFQAEKDEDDQAEEIQIQIQIETLPQLAPGKSPALVEAMFLGYDVAYTDGRLHRGVVERVVVGLS